LKYPKQILHPNVNYYAGASSGINSETTDASNTIVTEGVNVKLAFMATRKIIKPIGSTEYLAMNTPIEGSNESCYCFGSFCLYFFTRPEQ
jgi:hypothetical protein